MKVIKKYNQYRRDCWVNLECEGCQSKETIKDAYDDRNYWDNVVSVMECKKCGKSTKTLGLKYKVILTKYPEGEQH